MPFKRKGQRYIHQMRGYVRPSRILRFAPPPSVILRADVLSRRISLFCVDTQERFFASLRMTNETVPGMTNEKMVSREVIMRYSTALREGTIKG